MWFLTAIESSGIEVHGISFGAVSSRIDALGDAQIDIFGDGFAINGQPVGFGPIPTSPNPFGRLTGTLESGEPIDVDYLLQTGFGRTASINFIFAEVPEPTTALLLACGLVGLAAAHRRRLH